MAKGYSKQKRTCPYCGKVSWTGQIGVHIRYVHETDDQARFWPKVQKGEGCWLWTAVVNSDGYGHFRKQHGGEVYAHRFSYEIHHGPIPEGMHVLHSCDNTRCVNPAHLSLGTHSENMADMKAKGRHTHGAKNKWAKLTTEQVREIKANPPRLGHGGDVQAYAERYGVRGSAIRAIVQKRSWVHT